MEKILTSRATVNLFRSNALHVQSIYVRLKIDFSIAFPIMTGAKERDTDVGVVDSQ